MIFAILLLIIHLLFSLSEYLELKNLIEIILIIYSFCFMLIFFFKLIFKIPKKIPSFFKIGILIFLFYFTITTVNLYKVTKGGRERYKLSYTMAEMLNIMRLIEVYYLENGTHPFPYYKGSAKILLKLFKDIRYKDGWGSDILYWCFDNGKAYILQSAGKDKKFERLYLGLEKKKYEIPQKGYFSFAEFYVINGGIFTNMNEDTVYFTGTFAKWYEGFCKRAED